MREELFCCGFSALFIFLPFMFHTKLPVKLIPQVITVMWIPNMCSFLFFLMYAQ